MRFRYVLCCLGLLAALAGAHTTALAADNPASMIDDPACGTLTEACFDPAFITVVVGDTITWTNQSGLMHTATADDFAWTTRLLDTGESESVTFSQPGTFGYFCQIHPDMRGTIEVLPASATGTSSASP